MIKKSIVIGLIFIVISSFTIHKFYVSIYQIKYVSEKKELHITSRIFIDDLNKVLFEYYQTKTQIGEKEETKTDIDLMKKYMLERFFITVNKKPVQIAYLSNEKEDNVIICYFKVIGVSKINEIEIKNNILFELNEDQQNIIQCNFMNKKKDCLLDRNNAKCLLKI